MMLTAAAGAITAAKTGATLASPLAAILAGEHPFHRRQAAPFDVPSIAEHEKRWEKMPWRNCF
jgi:hypothetical protein